MKLFVLNEQDHVRGTIVDVDMSTIGDIIVKRNWSPGLYRGFYRDSKNFEKAYFLAFDVDSELTLEEAHYRLKNITHILAPSRNHQKVKITESGKHKPACDRFRVLIPLAVPITDGEQYKKALKIFASKYLPEFDSQCTDAARQFFASTSVYKIHHAAVYNHENTLLPLETADFLANTPSEGAGFNQGLLIAAKELFRSGNTLSEVKNILKPALLNNGWTDFNQQDEATLESAIRSIEEERREAEAAIPHWTRFLRQSVLVANVADDENYFVYNKVTKEKQYLTKQFIFRQLGRKEGNKFLEEGENVMMEYAPFTHQVFFINEQGHPTFNTYQPPAWLHSYFHNKSAIPHTPMPEFYHDLFMHMMNQDEASYNYLLDWVTNGLKRKNLTYLCALAAPGTGKNTLGNILIKLFGDSNGTDVPDQVFKSQFNSSLKNKQLVFVDEVSVKEGEQVDRLKSMVNFLITIEAKGKDAESVKNYANIYLASNRYDGLPLELGDRRFSIVNFTDIPIVSNPTLINKITNGEHINPQLIAQLGQHLWHRTPTHNMLVPFKSSKTQQVSEAQFKNWENDLRFYAKSNPGLEMTVDDIQRRVHEKFKHGLGASRIEELCQKCPELLIYSRDRQVVVFAGVSRLPRIA